MAWAKELSEFVIIKFNDFEVAGKFGVDGITGGKFSNGDPYSWKKRRGQSKAALGWLLFWILILTLLTIPQSSLPQCHIVQANDDGKPNDFTYKEGGLVAVTVSVITIYRK